MSSDAVVPAPVRDDAARATTLHPAGTGVLDLTYDSLLDPALHDATGPRRLRFARPGLQVTVDVVGSDELVLLLRVSPAPPATVQVLHLAGPGAPAPVTGGRCVLRAIPAGLTSLLLRRRDGEAVRTAWVLF